MTQKRSRAIVVSRERIDVTEMQMRLRELLEQYLAEFGPEGYTAEYFLDFVATACKIIGSNSDKAAVYQRLADAARRRFPIDATPRARRRAKPARRNG